MRFNLSLKDTQRIFKYGLIGLSGIGINSGVLWVLVNNSPLPFYLCSLIAIETSIISNFLLNDAYTWADLRQGSKLMRLWKYNASTAFSSVFINITVLLFLKEWVHIPYWAANLIGIGCGVCFNFIVNHHWTYGSIRLSIPKSIWIVTGLSLLWRLFIAASIGPGFDEAYYYAYALRPALSYFDHPPVVGFLAGFFPYLTGTANALTLRLGAVMLFTGSGLLFYRLARNFINDRETLFAVILFHAMPLTMLMAGVMILPDAGLVFFWLCALLTLTPVLIEGNTRPERWILAGLFTGLAMLSKYHGALLGMAVILFLLLKQRRQFLTAGPYLYGITAFAAFSPVLIWNARHDFVSFLFQGSRAAGSHISLSRFLQAIGGQIAYITPFIFFPLFFILIQIILKVWKTRNKTFLFYVLFGAFPVLLMLFISLSRPILPHWTLPGYLILLIPLGQWLAYQTEKHRSMRMFSWTSLCLILSMILLVLAHTRFGILPLEKMQAKGWISKRDVRMDATLDTRGWALIPKFIHEKYGDEDLFLFSHKWFLSGQIELAVQGKKRVMCFNEKDARGYDIWDADTDMIGKNALFICTNRYNLNPQKKYADYFEKVLPPDSICDYRHHRLTKTIYFYPCHVLKKHNRALKERHQH